MTITLVSHTLGTLSVDNSSTATYNFAGEDVTNGNRIFILVARGDGTYDFIVDNIAKTDGTATIGAWSLDATIKKDYGSGSGYINAALFSAPVTGTGTITVTVTANSGSYWFICGAEFHGDSGNIIVEDNNNTGSDNPVSEPTTASGTSVGAGLFIGILSTVCSSTTTHTPDTDFTQIAEYEDGSAHMTGSAIYRIVTTGTTDAAHWTLPTTLVWAAGMCVYKEQAASGYSVSVSDNITVTDTPTMGGVPNINVSDSIGVSDTPTMQLEGGEPVTLNINICPENNWIPGVRIYTP